MQAQAVLAEQQVDVVVRACGAVCRQYAQAAGHAQVHDQCAMRETQEDVLAAAFDGLHRVAAQQVGEVRHRPAQLRLAHHRATDHLVQQVRCDTAAGGLDLRQFGHSQSPVKCRAGRFSRLKYTSSITFIVPSIST